MGLIIALLVIWLALVIVGTAIKALSGTARPPRAAITYASRP